jgi:hypothetical protein
MSESEPRGGKEGGEMGKYEAEIRVTCPVCGEQIDFASKDQADRHKRKIIKSFQGLVKDLIAFGWK